jgi:replication initiation and membrane attachment protein DnaB
MSQIKIEIKKTCNFPKDDAMLNGVYSKITGTEAIILYNALYCETTAEVKCDNIEDFLSENNITQDS